jgi:hypothetical protein
MKLTSRFLVAAPLAAALTFGLAAVPATAAPAATSVAGVYTATVAVPKITSQPKSTTVASGKTATFTVKASSSGLKYQWYVKSPGSTKWVKISGTAATKSSYSVKTTTKLNKAQYRVKVSNKRGSVTSSAATLAVVTTPKITSQPKDVSTPVGASTTLKVSTSGGSLSYKWQKYYSTGWKTISGATKSSFTTKATKGTNKYRVIVSNKAGKVTSRTTSVIGTKPKITTHPTSTYGEIGTTKTLSVKVSGTPVTYQWQVKQGDSWKNISGATASSYKAKVVGTSGVEAYRVKVTNTLGSVYSTEAFVVATSTETSPFEVDTVFELTDYAAIFSQSRQEQIPDTGLSRVTTDITACYFYQDYADRIPWSDLGIEYLGNNSLSYTDYYEGEYYFADGDIWEFDELDVDGCVEFVGNAAVPTEFVQNGTWAISLYDGDFPWDTQYVRGVTSPIAP